MCGSSLMLNKSVNQVFYRTFRAGVARENNIFGKRIFHERARVYLSFSLSLADICVTDERKERIRVFTER